MTEQTLSGPFYEDSRILEQIEVLAANYNVPIQDLKPQVLLHLARFSLSEMQDDRLVQNEMLRKALGLKKIIEEYYNHLSYDLRSAPLTDFRLEIASQSCIELLVGKLHYLQSIRDHTTYLSLNHTSLGIPVAIIGLSPFDLHHLKIEPLMNEEILVVSRLYSIAQLPKNINSYFLGLVRKSVQKNQPKIAGMLTYLNRNAGFNGTIYKSTNWTVVALEHHTSYAYFQNDYVSDRFLITHFGTAQRSKLQGIQALAFSQLELRPLEIYFLKLKEGIEVPYQEVNNPHL